MTTEASPATTSKSKQIGGQHLRVLLASGPATIPLARVDRLTGYATLSGDADDYFLGWLRYHGETIPVFDLNRVLCDQPTVEAFGTRILLIRTEGRAAVKRVGLLAAGVTDTLAGAENELDLDSFLPMLFAMIPAAPVTAA